MVIILADCHSVGDYFSKTIHWGESVCNAY